MMYNHLVSSPETVAQTVTAITTSLSTNTGATCIDSSTHVTCTALTGGVAYTYAALPVDEIAPTLYLTAPTYTNTGFVLRANFSEPVYANGDTSRFIITNGNTGSALTMIGSGVLNPANGNTYSTGYSFVINPVTDGIVTVETLNQPGVDVGGNESASGALISIIYDATSPSVTLATIPGGLTTTT